MFCFPNFFILRSALNDKTEKTTIHFTLACILTGKGKSLLINWLRGPNNGLFRLSFASKSAP